MADNDRPGTDDMVRYRIDTRADAITIAYDNERELQWEIDERSPDRVTITAHGVTLCELTIDLDGSIGLAVHNEIPLEVQS